MPATEPGTKIRLLTQSPWIDEARGGPGDCRRPTTAATYDNRLESGQGLMHKTDGEAVAMDGPRDVCFGRGEVGPDDGGGRDGTDRTDSGAARLQEQRRKYTTSRWSSQPGLMSRSQIRPRAQDTGAGAGAAAAACYRRLWPPLLIVPHLRPTAGHPGRAKKGSKGALARRPNKAAPRCPKYQEMGQDLHSLVLQNWLID